ncbi:MAG: ferritin family protein [Clostridia bacterium]
MTIPFAQSKTRENLMRAFAGESQARNRYTFGASQAKAENLFVLASALTYTADQEKEHAEIFYRLLQDSKGENVRVDGAYPVDISDSLVQILRYAQHNEYEEYQTVYRVFGEIAQQEGYPYIATLFHGIAKIEKTHGDRFARYADLLDARQLFHAPTPTTWLCLNCGHLHTDTDAPQTCPICSHAQGYFLRADMIPFR